jgi:hypothetical protein
MRHALWTFLKALAAFYVTVIPIGTVVLCYLVRKRPVEFVNPKSEE